MPASKKNKHISQDGDRRLKSSEMRRFAELSGFEGDDADWQEEFQMRLAGATMDHGSCFAIGPPPHQHCNHDK